jgi:hypothetical protein
MTHENPDQPTVSSRAHSLPKGVHLVGSVPLSSGEEVFRTAGSILGGRLRRIPDSETGIRSGWIGWQFQLFASNLIFEMVTPPPNAYVPRSRLKLRSPRTSGAITFEQLGYADQSPLCRTHPLGWERFVLLSYKIRHSTFLRPFLRLKKLWWIYISFLKPTLTSRLYQCPDFLRFERHINCLDTKRR